MWQNFCHRSAVWHNSTTGHLLGATSSVIMCASAAAAHKLSEIVEAVSLIACNRATFWHAVSCENRRPAPLLSCRRLRQKRGRQPKAAPARTGSARGLSAAHPPDPVSMRASRLLSENRRMIAYADAPRVVCAWGGSEASPVSPRRLGVRLPDDVPGCARRILRTIIPYYLSSTHGWCNTDEACLRSTVVAVVRHHSDTYQPW